MKKGLFVGLALLMMLLIAGCNKTSSGGPTAATQYEGVWNGTWNVPRQDSGTITLYVSSDGTIYGTIHNITAVTVASLSGQVTGTGFTITYQYPGQSEITWVAGITSMTPYRIIGNYDIAYLATTAKGTFELEKQ